LAHLLQTPILIAFLFAGPFSHKYHLTQVSACQSCHKTAETSTQASDNLLPDRDSCLPCHDEVKIKEPRVMKVQIFNHAKHVSMKCADCHRGVPTDEAKTFFPKMADCIVCHSKVNPPESCKQCHAADFQLKPVDHTREFAEVHSTGKLKVDTAACAVCHGKNFRCQGCH